MESAAILLVRYPFHLHQSNPIQTTKQLSNQIKDMQEEKKNAKS